MNGLFRLMGEGEGVKKKKTNFFFLESFSASTHANSSLSSDQDSNRF